MPALCIEIGYFLRHGHFLTEVSLTTLGYQALERVYEWFLGSLVLGPVLAFAGGCTIYLMAVVLKEGMKGRGEKHDKVSKTVDEQEHRLELPA